MVEGVPVGGEDDYVELKQVGTRRDFAAEGFAPADHLEIGERLGAIDMARGAKVSGVAVLLPHRRRRPARARAAQPRDGHRDRQRVHPRHHADAGAPRGDGRHRVPRRARLGGLQARGRRPVPRGHLGGGARGPALRRDPRPRGRAAAVRRLVGLLPARGGLARPRHPRDHPRAPVPQGRDVRLLPCRGRRGRAPAAARLGGADARRRRAAVPRDRHGRRRSRAPAPPASSTARRGCPRRSAGSSSPRRRTARPSRPAGSPSASAPRAAPARWPP